MTERFVPVINKKTRDYEQDHLTDGTWIFYYVGQEDERDIMSDCVKPSYGDSGEYRINVMKPGVRNTSDYNFLLITDKVCGNKVAYMIRHNYFKSYNELAEYFRALGKKLDTYYKGNGAERTELKETLLGGN